MGTLSRDLIAIYAKIKDNIPDWQREEIITEFLENTSKKIIKKKLWMDPTPKHLECSTNNIFFIGFHQRY